MLRQASYGAYQRGVTLLEVMGGLAVGTIMIAGLATMANVSIEDTKAQQAALHQNALGKAVVSWMSDATNRSAVISTATTSAPRKITLAELTPHLPAGFSAQNPYQQTVCVMAYYDSATERIEVAATTEGGVTINDAQLGYIVAHAGSGAGAIYASQPTVARGAFGSWQVTVADYTTSAAARNCSGTPAAAGNLMTLLPFDESGLFGMTGAGEWLARNEIPGRPELNRMNTTLDMGDNRVVGLQQVLNVPTDTCTAAREGKAGRTTTGAPRLCASGAWVAAACSTGDLASATDGKLLSCQGGVWKTQGSAFWEDAVTDATSLPACSASISGQTRVVLNAADGAGRPRAYTCNGAAWAALALDNNGNLTVPTSAQVGNTAVGVNGSVGATGRIATGILELKTVVSLGGACSPNGSLARTAAGEAAECSSSVWRQLGAETAGQYSFFHSATCPSGWTPANGLSGTLDLRGVFVRGWDNGRGLDSGRGRNSYQADALQDITGSVSSYRGVFESPSGAFYAGGSSGATYEGPGPSRGGRNAVIFDASRVARTANETRPKNVAMLICMKN